MSKVSNVPIPARKPEQNSAPVQEATSAAAGAAPEEKKEKGPIEAKVKESANIVAVLTKVAAETIGKKVPGAPLINPGTNAGIYFESTKHENPFTAYAGVGGSAAVTMIEGKLLPLPLWVADVVMSNIGDDLFGPEFHRAAGGYVFGNVNTIVKLGAANLDNMLGDDKAWKQIIARIQNGDQGVIWQQIGKAVERTIEQAEKAGIPVREARDAQIKYTRNGVEIAKTVMRAWVLAAEKAGVPVESIKAAFTEAQKSIDSAAEAAAIKSKALLQRIL